MIASSISTALSTGTKSRKRYWMISLNTPRAFSHSDIMRRYMAAMVNEGANVLHQGIALRPADVDTVFLSGYGFPKDRGGPMTYADSVGLASVLADIQAFAKDDPLFWKASRQAR